MVSILKPITIGKLLSTLKGCNAKSKERLDRKARHYMLGKQPSRLLVRFNGLAKPAAPFPAPGPDFIRHPPRPRQRH
jgi:hypothetical protein